MFSYAAFRFKSKIFFMPVYTRQILLTLTGWFWYISVCLRDKETWGYLHKFLVDNEHQYLIKKTQTYDIDVLWWYRGLKPEKKLISRCFFWYQDVFFGQCSGQKLIFLKKNRDIKKKNLISCHITRRFLCQFPPRNSRSKTENTPKKTLQKFSVVIFFPFCEKIVDEIWYYYSLRMKLQLGII